MTGAAGESSLPLPDAIAQAHSNVLTQRLVAAAELQPLPIAEFMQRCLYEPGFGYYMAGAQKFGPDGDFITAPEVSPLFGSCIAAQCAEILAITGGGLLELGAGSGRLALSIIQALPAEHLSTYNIVEPSPELALRQAELLEAALPAEVFAKVCWLTELPSDFTGVILANEVMDALPVERLIRCRGGFAVEAVGLSREAGHPLACLDLPSAALSEAKGDELSAALQAIEVDIERAWPLDYRSEVSLLLSPWVQSLAQSLASGVCLLIDYGYPRRENATTAPCAAFIATARTTTSLIGLACKISPRMSISPQWSKRVTPPG